MSESEWHYVVDGKSVGPVTTDDIYEKFKNAVIGRDTLIWSDGMSDWQPIHEVEVFNSLTKKSSPPPIPGQPPAIPSIPEIKLDLKELNLRDSPESGSVNAPLIDSVDNHTILSTTSTIEPPIPWLRYFARILDISILATILISAAIIISAYVSMPIFVKIYSTDARVLTLISLPFVMILNAIIITIFGNSIGKKIFGIHVVNLRSNKPFTLVENIARELRVWVKGMALGLPFISFFTLIPECNRVSKGKPASYDEGIASVRPYSDSSLRRLFGIAITISVLALILYSNNIEKQNLAKLSMPHEWVNPKTQLSTTIPKGWESDTVKGQGSAGDLYMFTNMDTGIIALLAVETMDNTSLSTYANALEKSLSTNMRFDSDWAEYTIPKVWGRSALMREGDYPAELLLTRVGSSFWRVVYVDQVSKKRKVGNPELTRALFNSVGVK
ncbi:RDD family protein [Ochrobactrum soli]|nr:RDD family protein [[Ochrobactrum] soli]